MREYYKKKFKNKCLEILFVKRIFDMRDLKGMIVFLYY